MVTVATVQRETTDSKQNLNLATCQSETSSDASQNSKGCTVPPPSVFLLLWKAVLCLQCLFYLWTFCWCSSPVLFYSQFLPLKKLSVCSACCCRCLCCTSVPKVWLRVTQSFCLDWNCRSCSKKGVGCSCAGLGIGKRRSCDSQQLQGELWQGVWHLAASGEASDQSPLVLSGVLGQVWAERGSGWVRVGLHTGSWVLSKAALIQQFGPSDPALCRRRRSQVPPWATPALRQRSSREDQYCNSAG